MAFEFVIEDSVEIYRDPGGQYHHWTIITGRLQTGFIRAGQLVRLPGMDGVDTVGSALGFIAKGQNLGEIVDFTFPHLFGLIVWQLAPLRQTITPGSVVNDCPHDLYLQTLLRLLEQHPERILHPHGSEHPDMGCEDCEYTLSEKPEAIPLLQSLVAGGDPYLAKRAAAALEKYFSSPEGN